MNFKEYGEIYRPKDILIHGIYQRLKGALVIKRADDSVEIASEADETFQKMTGNQLILLNFKDGSKLVFGQKLLFNVGSAELKGEMKPVLKQVANFINPSSYQIYIDGHTDDTPINSGEYPTNEDLAVARAYNMMDYLVNEKGIPQESAAIRGYGEHHPVASNDTSMGRQNNRRVEMIFKNKRCF